MLDLVIQLQVYIVIELHMYKKFTLYELQRYKKLKDKPEYVPLANQFFRRASPVRKHPDNGSSQILFSFPEIANSIKIERDSKEKL